MSGTVAATRSPTTAPAPPDGGSPTGPARDDVGAFARGGAGKVLGAAIGGIASFGLTALVTRGLGTAAAAGAFFAAVAAMMILTRLAQAGAGVGLVRFVPAALVDGRPGRVRPLILAAVVPVAVASAVLGAVAVLRAGDIAQAVGDGAAVTGIASYVRWSGAFLVPLALLPTVLSATRGLGTMTPTVVTQDLALPALRVAGMGLALTVLAATPAAIAVGWWGPTAAATVAAGLWLRWLLREVPGRWTAPDRRLLASFWRFCAPRAVSGFFAVTLQWLGTLLLAALATAADAAVYAATTRYLVIGTVLQAAILQAFQPAVSRSLARRDRGAANDLFRVATGWSVLLTWPLYLVVAVHGPTLLEVFGPEYTRGATAMSILAVAWLLGTALGPVDAVLVMGGRSLWSMVNLGAALAVNLVANVILVPRLGLEGAAIAWAASIATHNLLPLVQVRWTMGLHPFGRAPATAVALAATTVGLGGSALRSWLGGSPAATVSAIGISGATYLVAVLVLRRPLQLDLLAAALRGRGQRGSADHSPTDSRSSIR